MIRRTAQEPRPAPDAFTPGAPERPLPSEPDAGEARRSPAPAVTRAAGILVLLAERGELSLADISREMGLPRSSTLNLCTAMEETQLVRRVPAGYALGRLTVELGGAYVRGFDLVPEFYRYTAEDPVLTGEIVYVATLVGTEALYLARHDGRSRMVLTATIGDRFPAAISAVGTALLMELDDAEIGRRYADPGAFERWTERSVADLDALLAMLHACRERGYAIDDRGSLPGIVGVGLSLPPFGIGKDRLALGCALPAASATPARIAEVVDALRGVRAHLTSWLALHPGHDD